MFIDIKRLIIILVSGLLLLSLEAHAFTFKTCYGNKVKWRNADLPIQFRASAVSFPKGHAYSDAIEVALKRWNENPSHAAFKPLIYGDNYVGLANYESEFWFVNSLNATSMEYKRVICTPNKHYIYTSDIRYNASLLSTMYSGNKKQKLFKYNFWKGSGKHIHFRRVTTHELGHSLGLQHESRIYNIMGSDPHYQTNGSLARAYVGENASDGAVFLYGLGDQVSHNLIVSHFKYEGIKEPGNYSSHQFTTIYRNGNPLESVLTSEINFDHPFFPYVLGKGKTYEFEFTYENAGSEDLTGIDVGFYLSPNDYISTSDLLIRTESLNLNRDIPATVKTGLSLPHWIPDGKYWLGVIVDHKNKISEVREDDNATYLPVYIKSMGPGGVTY